MQLSSPAFQTGATIPEKYTGDGEDMSPGLEWRNVPNGTKSFLVYCEDTDAPRGTFHHWAVWNIPPEWRLLKEGLPGQGDQVHQAVNDFGKVGYAGPLPPEGDKPHHYHFNIAALDVEHLSVRQGAKVEEVVAVARDHVIGQAELVGTYRRQGR